MIDGYFCFIIVAAVYTFTVSQSMGPKHCECNAGKLEGTGMQNFKNTNNF